MGGEPPPEDKSELVGGDKDRESGTADWFSSHCYIEAICEWNKQITRTKHTAGRPAREDLFLRGD